MILADCLFAAVELFLKFFGSLGCGQTESAPGPVNSSFAPVSVATRNRLRRIKCFDTQRVRISGTLPRQNHEVRSSLQ
jgi:hypothetical protein